MSIKNDPTQKGKLAGERELQTMISFQEGTRLTKGARVATKLFDYAVEFLPAGRPYALCIRFAPSGGPSLGEVAQVWFDDIIRVYSFGG